VHLYQTSINQSVNVVKHHAPLPLDTGDPRGVGNANAESMIDRCGSEARIRGAHQRVSRERLDRQDFLSLMLLQTEVRAYGRRDSTQLETPTMPKLAVTSHRPVTDTTEIANIVQRVPEDESKQTHFSHLMIKAGKGIPQMGPIRKSFRWPTLRKTGTSNARENLPRGPRHRTTLSALVAVQAVPVMNQPAAMGTLQSTR
jgi:hypothetical protein